MVTKEHRNISGVMPKGHCLSGCYRQHKKKKRSGQESPKKLLSVSYFFEAFQTDVARSYGWKGMWAPITLICDGSMVLMQAIYLSFAKKNLHDTINHYYRIASGKATEADFEVPILQHCLSQVMKNAKEMCRK